jgi:nitrogenase molybdenum-cofactor synthesis protein NifE
MPTSIDKLLADGCNADVKHKLCRSRGGESCAFDGAAIVLMPIADAAHIVHGPINCAGGAWEGRGVHSTAGDLHRRGFTTDMAELDIVYGGEKRLEATVREVVAAAKPAAVFVYATCVTGLIGEDIEASCKKLSAELWVPVIPVCAPGFMGPKNLGNRIAGEVLVEHVIGTAEPASTTPTDITLIGEYNVAGDIELVEPLLRECGIHVLSHVTGNARFEEIRYAHRAKAAAVVCSRALINVAAELSRRYGVPSVEVSFFGATETAKSLRLIAEVLESVSPEAVGVRERVEAVIARREAALAEALAPHAALRGKKAVLYSGGVKSWSMASALLDLGVEILAVGTKKSSHEDEEKVRGILGQNVRLVEDISPAVIRRLFAEEGADLLVAGGRNRYLAAKEGWPFIDVNQEREHAYASYDGLVNVAHDLHESIRFYEAQAAAAVVQCAAPHEPTPVRKEERTAVIDPLKNAPTVGAVLALQGIDATLPVLHAAQGCSFLGKVLMIRHFNEPIAFAATKLFTEEVVLGSDEAAEKTIRPFAEKPADDRPDLVALVSGALTEVKGEDVHALAHKLDSQFGPTIVAVQAADYDGGLEEGYATTVAALAALADDVAPSAHPGPDRITVLAGAYLTPGDAVWLHDTCEEFGLQPILLPDLGALDGNRQGLSPLATGGTSLADIRSLGDSSHTLVLGASLEGVARSLHGRFGTPYTVIDSAHGLAATDLLLATLSLLSGSPAPTRFERQRRVLIDAMRDAQLELAGSRVTLALESDHALSLAGLLAEVAVRTIAIVPTAPAHTPRILAEEVVVGDFASVPGSTELLIAGSHGARTAVFLGAAHLEAGFPVFANYGASRTVSLGYAGATALVDAAANALAARERAHHPSAPAPAARVAASSPVPTTEGGVR